MGALAVQLQEELGTLTAEPLDPEHIAQVEPAPGVYQLHKRDTVVYVGKADRNLRARLEAHRRKIAGRLNIGPSEMAFSGLYLAGDWIPVGPEKMLISRLAPSWNKKGFGNKDPGRRRDTTALSPEHFDSQYPADLDWVLEGLPSGQRSVEDALRLAKAALPYLLRYETVGRAKKPHPDYKEASVGLDGPLTAQDLFQRLAAALPRGWQITALPGYVILYKESRAYSHARATWISSAPP